MANFFEEALASIGAAVSDVREKVVEEAYFGRVVSNGQDAPETQTASPQTNYFEEALGSKLQQIDISPGNSKDAPEPGGGMEI